MSPTPPLRAALPERSWGIGTAGFAFGTASTAEAIAALDTAVGDGARILDTARAYTRSGEESTAEALVGRTLQATRRRDILVSTKGGHWREGDEFLVDGRPATLRRHCEASLRLLGVERIDIYHLHHPDPAVPIADSVAELVRLRQDGLIAHIGLSNVTLAQLDEAEAVGPIAAVQNRLSLDRPDDVALARECAVRGVVYLAYSPLGGAGARPTPAVLAVARRIETSPARVMLSWLYAQSPAIVPIVGATRPQTVHDSAGAATVVLDTADLAILEGDDGDR